MIKERNNEDKGRKRRYGKDDGRRLERRKWEDENRYRKKED